MREFNTSGPNIPRQHYTLERQDLIQQGINLVEKERFLPFGHRDKQDKVLFRQLAQTIWKTRVKVVHFILGGSRNGFGWNRFLRDFPGPFSDKVGTVEFFHGKTGFFPLFGTSLGPFPDPCGSSSAV